MTRRHLRPGRIFANASFKGLRIVTRVQDGVVYFISLTPAPRGGHSTIRTFISWAYKEVAHEKAGSKRV